MRTLGISGIAALFLFMMASPAAYSQDQRDENKPQTQEAPKQHDEKAPKTDNRTQQENRAQQNDRARQDDKAQQKEQERQQKDQEKENKRAQQQQDRNMRDQQHEQRPVDNRPDNNRQMDNRQQDNRRMDNHQEMGHDQNRHEAADRGRHIPDDQFRSHFGREHRFHVERDRIVNVSQPVVVYGGYSFQLAEPWPSEWSYDDDCYIDYVDGEYYMFDVMHPGIRLAVFVVG